MANIKLRAEGFNLKDGVRMGLNSKLLPIDNLFPDGTLYDVFIKKTENQNYKCEIKVQNGRDFIRSEATGSRIEYSIDNAIKILKKRVHKLKTMKIDKKRRNFVDSIDIEVEEPLNSEIGGILRVKYLEDALMSEEDAIIELESLNHDFFVFRNTDKEDVLCVLYRRELGYGLLVIE